MSEFEDNRDAPRQPYRVNLSGFISDEEIGLGDAIKKITTTFGIKLCGGCNWRAVAMNSWLVFNWRNR